ncbi:MAG: DUF4258 domain-containing protein [Candidatus Eremiobacterota bacterium]
MNLSDIKEKIKSNEYEISFHAEKERYADNIEIIDLETAISNGEILENYRDDIRGESCLILGYANNQPVHIVCGYTQDKYIRIITVYKPEKPKWINERTRRSGGEKNV